MILKWIFITMKMINFIIQGNKILILNGMLLITSIYHNCEETRKCVCVCVCEGEGEEWVAREQECGVIRLEQII